jgi:hypothetical protein
MARKYDDGSEILRASDVEPASVEFLWREHIPKGMFSLVAGRPGCRKSMFTAHVAAEVTQQGGAVIYSNVEDPAAQVTRPRLEAAGADLTKILFWRPFLPAMLEQTERVIREHDVRLIVMDPMVKHLTVSIWNDAEFGEAMVPVFDMLDRTGCTLLGAHHTKKNISANADPQEAIGGSAGSLIGSARAAFIMGPNPHDNTERVVAPVKFNVADFPFSLVFEMDVLEFYSDTTGEKTAEGAYLICTDDHSSISATTVLRQIAGGSPKQGATPSIQKRAAASAWLTDYLSAEAKPQRMVQEDAGHSGFSWATMKRAAEGLEILHARRGYGAGGAWFWMLPPDHPSKAETSDCTCAHPGYQHPADEKHPHGACLGDGCKCAKFVEAKPLPAGVNVTTGGTDD